MNQAACLVPINGRLKSNPFGLEGEPYSESLSMLKHITALGPLLSPSSNALYNTCLLSFM
jgi:hypothetical protein